MELIVSSFIPFPNIAWWAAILGSKQLLLDSAEHFQKMTYRNRYYISGSNGMIQLSIPLIKGRNQHTPLNDVAISNMENWQVQHWRTLVSVYKRTPYFEYYEQGLVKLFDHPFDSLATFSMETIQWVCKQLKLDINIDVTNDYVKEYPESVMDLRNMRPGAEKKDSEDFPEYYQLFSDRTGFVPCLSILDLLFAEGPYTLQWIKSNRQQLLPWIMTGK